MTTNDFYLKMDFPLITQYVKIFVDFCIKIKTLHTIISRGEIMRDKKKNKTTGKSQTNGAKNCK